jgi:tetratricopeptide (TPR) repeat protein
MTRCRRLGVLTAACLFALSVTAGAAYAAGDPEPRGPSQGQQKSPNTKDTKKKKKNDKQSEQQFRDGYRAAYGLVQAGQYAEAFAAFKALDQDDHPDVANYLGYTARKMGNYELSKVWYERALEADPLHVRTWQYYGMWHVEQGNRLKAQDFLEKIEAICGNKTCKEYQDLKGGLEGTVSY